MTKNNITQIKWRLCAIVGAGIVIAQVASVVHLIDAYAMANSNLMAVGLSMVTVMMSASLIVLSIISPPGLAKMGIQAGIFLLLLAEWLGNLAIGGLFVQARMPNGVADFFGVSPSLAHHTWAFLYAGIIPLLVLILITALVETIKGLMTEQAPSAQNEAWLRSILDEEATTSQAQS